MDFVTELEKIKTLLDKGAISDEEFKLLKHKIIEAYKQNPNQDLPDNDKYKNLSKRSLVFRKISYVSFLLILIIGGYVVIANFESVKFAIEGYFNENHSKANLTSESKQVSTFRGEEIGGRRVVEFEFTKTRNQMGQVFIVPDNKIWTPLYFTYKDFGDNLFIGIPRILTKQNTNRSVGRMYFDLHIYEDPATGTWWENKSGFLVARERDFHSVAVSIRNQKGLYGRNVLYVDGVHWDVKYTIYFVEEDLH
ncbi:MAG: SHOCT domain-containing protein [Methylomonas sp.]|jgi:hypothetical protein|nr:SHOCT domain-containing protein [Methylomonas sp.]